MTRILRLLSHLLPLLALGVIVLGAYVRLSDAGLGCPDWPGCYGHVTVPSHDANVHLNDPNWHARPLEAGKAWREMIHRYLASTLGLGIVVLAVGALSSARRRAAGLSPVVFLLVPLVIFQGLLGMWTVTLLLKPLVVSAHLLGGLATLSLLWWNLLSVRGLVPVAATRGAVAGLARVAVLVLVAQIFLGGWTSANYAALACTDFPTCQGSWWPNTDFHEAYVLWRGLGINYEFGVLDTPARTAIHVGHRLGALFATLVIASAAVLAWRTRESRLRRVASCILAALALQVCLGITNVLGGLPLPVAVSHNGVAAVLLMSLLTLVHFTRRKESLPSC
ncbi:MAG: COX15/CtaA family protein [Gammaproteobacteria bacterium]|nr:COX15/CtaA family protein [Gammaproteobacteria bacterium]